MKSQQETGTPGISIEAPIKQENKVHYSRAIQKTVQEANDILRTNSDADKTWPDSHEGVLLELNRLYEIKKLSEEQNEMLREAIQQMNKRKVLVVSRYVLQMEQQKALKLIQEALKTKRLSRENFDLLKAFERSIQGESKKHAEQGPAAVRQKISISIDGITANHLITGHVFGLAQSRHHEYKIVVYVHTDSWYIHPYHGQGEGESWAMIRKDGNWQIKTVQRGFNADKIAAMVLSQDYPVPIRAANIDQIPNLAITIHQLQGTDDFGKL
jgi:hypothetical protein